MSNRHKEIPLFVKPQQRTMRYLDEFLKLRCSTDLIRSEVFPNSKEITESFAAFNAVRKYGPKYGFDLFDPNILLISVGDGNTPRTAATFAFRSKWVCLSVDPRMKPHYWGYDGQPIKKMYAIKAGIEDVPRPIGYDKVVIVCVHSHASLEASVKACNAREKLVIAMPCCVDLSLPYASPNEEYNDPGILSPEDLVKVYYLEDK